MKTLVLPFIHFAALIAFLAYKTKSPLFQFVKGRHQEILTGLSKSKLQAAEAAQKKAEVEAKLRGLDTEVSQILVEWKDREAAQMKAIRESAEKVLAQVKSDAELNKKSLAATFQQETAKTIGALVVARAEEKLKAGMNPDSHLKMNRDFIQKVLGA